MTLRDRLRPGTFLAIGHRGARGLAPENTLPGFRAALQHGVDMVELDVQLTADDEVVVIHDPTVARTTDWEEARGPGAVAELPLAELRRLDAGHAFTPDGGDTHPYRGDGLRVDALPDRPDGNHLRIEVDPPRA